MQKAKSSTILTRWWTAQKDEKAVKEYFDIQAQGPQQREAPGICPVCSMVNPALLVSFEYKFLDNFQLVWHLWSYIWHVLSSDSDMAYLIIWTSKA